MSDPISTFFDAWQLDSADARIEKITSAVSPHISYDDPRTTHTVNGITALGKYVGLFSANAPGWSAKVVSSDTTAGMTRATVAFSGSGPDGKGLVQLGQYFVEMDGDLISRMVGFVGNSAQE